MLVPFNTNLTLPSNGLNEKNTVPFYLLMNANLNGSLGVICGLLTENPLIPGAVFAVIGVASYALGVLAIAIGKKRNWSTQTLITLSHSAHLLNSIIVLVSGVALGVVGPHIIALSLPYIGYRLWEIGKNYWDPYDYTALTKMNEALKEYGSLHLLQLQEEKQKTNEVLQIDELLRYVETLHTDPLIFPIISKIMVNSILYYPPSQREGQKTRALLDLTYHIAGQSSFSKERYQIHSFLLKELFALNPDLNQITQEPDKWHLNRGIPLINSLYGNDPSVIPLFATAHANFNIRESRTDNTPLMVAAEKNRISFEMVAMLLEYGADPKMSKGAHQRAIHLAELELKVTIESGLTYYLKSIRSKIELLAGYEDNATPEQRRKAFTHLINCSCTKQASYFLQFPGVIPDDPKEREDFIEGLLKTVLETKQAPSLQFLLERFNSHLQDYMLATIASLDPNQEKDATVLSALSHYRKTISNHIQTSPHMPLLPNLCALASEYV